MMKIWSLIPWGLTILQKSVMKKFHLLQLCALYTLKELIHIVTELVHFSTIYAADMGKFEVSTS